VDEEEPNVGPGWHVGNLSDADWALRRMASLQRQIKENDALLEANVARLQLRHAKMNEALARGLAFFAAKVEEYATLHRAELLGGGKRKSRKLLHGSIGWRKTGGGFKMNDKEALLAWAQKQPVELNLVRIKEEPAWDRIKEDLRSTGELPPGVDVEPEGETFKIEALSMEAANGNE
jgi:phage host-nuclease inhibitor protein Gam